MAGRTRGRILAVSPNERIRMPVLEQCMALMVARYAFQFHGNGSKPKSHPGAPFL
jgi:hypothetical protein